MIQINDLYYKNVISDLSISFSKNKFYTISGPNRCGKTSLLKIINRDILTDEDIRLNNKSIYDYDIINYNNIVGLLDSDNKFIMDTVENVIKFILIKHNIYNKDYLKSLLVKYELYDYRKMYVDELDVSKKIYLKFIEYVLDDKKIILIDNIDNYCSNEDMMRIIKIINGLKESITFIMTINNLEYSLESDYLYIIDGSSIVLEGIPFDVLLNDTVINKVGLELPFMFDLSIKLNDYELLNEIVLDMDRMIDKLWK